MAKRGDRARVVPAVRHHAICTFLSFSPETEIEGRRPWRRAGKDGGRGAEDENGADLR